MHYKKGQEIDESSIIYNHSTTDRDQAFKIYLL